MKKRHSAISLSSVRERIRRLDEEIGRLESRRSDLKIKREALAELIEAAKPAISRESGNGNRASSGEGPKVAILRVLTAKPGLKPSDIVAEILDSVKTGAKDPRKNLYQSILNLKNKGVLKVTQEGGLEIARPSTN
jgi:hypothetical protein